MAHSHIRVSWADVPFDSAADEFGPEHAYDSVIHPVPGRAGAVHQLLRDRASATVPVPMQTARGCKSRRRIQRRTLVVKLKEQLIQRRFGSTATWNTVTLMLIASIMDSRPRWQSPAVRPAWRLRSMLRHLGTYHDGKQRCAEFSAGTTVASAVELSITSMLLVDLLPCGFSVAPSALTTYVIVFARGNPHYWTPREGCEHLPALVIDALGCWSLTTTLGSE